MFCYPKAPLDQFGHVYKLGFWIAETHNNNHREDYESLFFDLFQGSFKIAEFQCFLLRSADSPLLFLGSEEEPKPSSATCNVNQRHRTSLLEQAVVVEPITNHLIGQLCLARPGLWTSQGGMQPTGLLSSILHSTISLLIVY